MFPYPLLDLNPADLFTIRNTRFVSPLSTFRIHVNNSWIGFPKIVVRRHVTSFGFRVILLSVTLHDCQVTFSIGKYVGILCCLGDVL